MIYLNGENINVTLFPDNTSQVWKLDEKHFKQERATVRWDYSHEGEVMQLAQLKHLLDFSGVERTSLHIDYLPYGRQDKWFDNNATFALLTFAGVLNTLHFEEIFIMDPHSNRALEFINNAKAVYPHGPLLQAIYLTDSNMICYPDNGAVVKYTGIYKTLLPTIYGSKNRDQATGHITDYTVIGNCRENRVLIVDDICDGGKTFEILTKDLLLRGAREVNLFVTHGLFSKGLRPLKEAGINKIFTNKGEAFTMADGGIGFRQTDLTDFEKAVQILRKIPGLN